MSEDFPVAQQQNIDPDLGNLNTMLDQAHAEQGAQATSNRSFDQVKFDMPFGQVSEVIEESITHSEVGPGDATIKTTFDREDPYKITPKNEFGQEVPRGPVKKVEARLTTPKGTKIEAVSTTSASSNPSSETKLAFTDTAGNAREITLSSEVVAKRAAVKAANEILGITGVDKPGTKKAA